MYNKLFAKILDSSIWLEDDKVRLVWITFLAAMDQDGFVALSAVGNVAARARVSEDDAAKAIAVLEGPDAKNPGQEHQGRRIERIPGSGWYVLNAGKYRDIIKAETVRAQNRERAKTFRAKKKQANTGVTLRHENVTPSEAVSDAVAEAERERTHAQDDPPEDLQPGMTGMSPNVDAVWIAKRWHTLSPKGTCALDKASHQFARGLLVGIDKHDLMKAVESNPGRLPHEIVDALKPKMAKPAKRKITTEEIAAGVEKLLNDKEAFKRATE